MPEEVWAHVVPHLPQPWPEEAARFDLRWLHDQGEPLKRRALAKRWGWTPDEVRTELRHPERWWDPQKGPVPVLTQTDPARPNLTQTDPTGTDEAPEPAAPDPPRPNLTQPDPPSPQRVDPPPPPPSPPRSSAVVDAGARVLAVARLLALQEADSPELGMVADRDRQAVVRAAARHGEPKCEALWAWSGVSDDPLVAGCRNGWRRWSSLLKAPHGDARIAAAWAWHEAGRPLPQATGPPARAAPRDAFDDFLAQHHQPPEQDREHG